MTESQNDEQTMSFEEVDMEPPSTNTWVLETNGEESFLTGAFSRLLAALSQWQQAINYQEESVPEYGENIFAMKLKDDFHSFVESSGIDIDNIPDEIMDNGERLLEAEEYGIMAPLHLPIADQEEWNKLRNTEGEISRYTESFDHPIESRRYWNPLKNGKITRKQWKNEGKTLRNSKITGNRTDGFFTNRAL